jgi:hypothetical protein
LLHPPQLKSSVLRTTHEFPQALSPDAHLSTHFPCEQSCPLWHGEPHALQFFASDIKLVQPLPQSVMPDGQAHCPPWHVLSFEHSALHPPQL